MTLDQFIAQHGISMRAVCADRNPNMDASDDMDHWRCTLACGRRRMTIVFSMGSGHQGKPPKARDVLNCIASDAPGADELFETWCSEFGYDSDSRTADRTFIAVQRQTKRARAFLGTAAFCQLVENTERL